MPKRTGAAKVAGNAPSPAAIGTLQQAVRAAKDGAARKRALDLITGLEADGQVPSATAAYFRALVERRAGRLASVIDEAGVNPGDKDHLPLQIMRLSTMIEADRYRQGRAELTEILRGPLKRRRLSATSAERLLLLVERFRADDAVEPGWLQLVGAVSGESQNIPALLRRLEARRANAEAASRIKILSLGLHCLPWMLPNRWGLRSADDLFTLDTPFNLAVHDIPTLIRLLGNDFEGYTDAANMRLVKTPKGKEMPYNKAYRAVFNHHSLRYWIENDFAKLVGALDEKVRNVRAALLERNLVVLLGAVPYQDPAEGQALLRGLYGALCVRTVEPPLLIASTQKDLSLAPGTTRIDDRIYHLSMPYPSREYVWQDALNTPDGLDYETRYVDALLAILREHRLWPEGPQA